jgi:tight adherence protein B
MQMQTIALFFLVSAAIGGVAWVFLYPILSGERKAEKRMDTVARSGSVAPAARAGRNAIKSRREQVEGSLKELEKRNAKSVPLSVKITQAGLSWSTRRFWITSGVLGASAFLAIVMVDGGLLAAFGMAFAAGFGLPLWLLKFLKKRREAKFLTGFPDAVDIIVRGIKAGLPLVDSLRIITVDAPEPMKSEFRAILAPRPSAFRSARPAASSTSAFRSRRPTSSASSSASSRRRAATCRRRWATCRGCCASARR